MQAIEFEAVAHNRFIRIPDNAPEGVSMRVLLLVDELEKTVKPVEVKKLEQLQAQLTQAEQDIAEGRYVALDKAGVSQLFVDLKQRY
jgi:hypothetical protein